MELLVLACLNPKGEYQECSFLGNDLEAGFDVLTLFVNKDWQLTYIDLVNKRGRNLSLPVDAFDGAYMSGPINHLQEPWEQFCLSVNIGE